VTLGDAVLIGVVGKRRLGLVVDLGRTGVLLLMVVVSGVMMTLGVSGVGGGATAAVVVVVGCCCLLRSNILRYDEMRSFNSFTLAVTDKVVSTMIA